MAEAGIKPVIDFNEFRLRIARFMKEHYKEHPGSSRLQMTKGIYISINPGVAFVSFDTFVKSIIDDYGQLRRSLRARNANLVEHELVLSRCPYYNDLYLALKYSYEYRDVDWTI